MAAVRQPEPPFDRLSAHEEICASRYEVIAENIKEIKEDAKADRKEFALYRQDVRKDARSQSRLILGILLGVLGWLAVQLWNTVPHALAAPAVAVNVQP